MRRPKFAAKFIDEPLRSEAKSSFRLFSKRLKMSLERPGRQTVVGVEKYQEVSGTPLEAEVSRRGQP